MASQALPESETPAGVPPPGVTPNLDHPQDTLFPDVVGVGVVMLVICVFAVGLATIQRLRNAHRLTAADWTRLLGLIFTAGYSSTVFALASSAIHQWDLRVSWYNVPSHIKLLYAQSLLLSVCIFFSKLSILLLYFEVFQIKRMTRWLIWCGVIFDVLVYWPGPFLVSYFCAPHIGQEWNIVTYGHCSSTNVWGVIQGTAAVALDVYIFVLPLPTIWALQMTKSKKIAVTAVFGTAVLGLVASVAALVYRVKLYVGGASQDTDFNWLIYQVLICVMSENGVALLVSSMPAASVQIRNLAGRYDKLWSNISSKMSSSKLSSSKGASSGSHESTELGIVRGDYYQVEYKNVGDDAGSITALNQPPARPFEQIYGRNWSS